MTAWAFDVNFVLSAVQSYPFWIQQHCLHTFWLDCLLDGRAGGQTEQVVLTHLMQSCFSSDCVCSSSPMKFIHSRVPSSTYSSTHMWTNKGRLTTVLTETLLPYIWGNLTRLTPQWNIVRAAFVPKSTLSLGGKGRCSKEYSKDCYVDHLGLLWWWNKSFRASSSCPNSSS